MDLIFEIMKNSVIWVLYFISAIFIIVIIIMSYIRIKYSVRLKKDLEKVIKQNDENYNYWSQRLIDEQKGLQQSMDIINREYYEYLLNKKKKQQTEKSNNSNKKIIIEVTEEKKEEPKPKTKRKKKK